MTYEELESLTNEVDGNMPSIHVDLTKGELRVNGKSIVSRWAGDFHTDPVPETEVLDRIRRLYEAYSTSLPDCMDQRHTRCAFKAPSFIEIDEATASGRNVGQGVSIVPREIARIRLEGYVLCVAVSGFFQWDEETHGKWFWRPTDMPELVVLREWIQRGTRKTGSNIEK